MLYISSRSKTDSFTAHRTLCVDLAPDGGVFIPYQIPDLKPEMLNEIGDKSFGQTVADVLNLFYSCKLTAWDVDVCAGRMPIRLKEMSHRLMVAEIFHNPAGQYNDIEKNLYQKLAGADACENPTVWARIAIRIALLFAVYAIIPEPICRSFDICVNSDDFLAPMAAWYARKMGLPIRTIICSCNSNSAVWDLLQKGEAGTAGVPEQIEGLIYQCLGSEAVNRFADARNRKGVYQLTDDALAILSNGLNASVVSKNRINNLIRSIYRTNNYYISEETAVAFGGLQDYRASTGESRYTLILMDLDPRHQASRIAAAIGVDEKDVLKAF